MVAQDTATTTSGSSLFSLLLILLLFIPIVFMLVNQRRRTRFAHDLNASLQVGDEVVTTSGIFGTIRELDDTVAVLEIAPDTLIRLDRRAIGMRTEPPTGPAAASDPQPER